MFLTLIAIGVVVVLCLLFGIWKKRTKDRDRDDVELHGITPDALHALLASNQEVFLLDVRQPLDLLAHAEIIPGAKRIFPKEVLEKPSLIPKEKDLVVYCTCPGEKTSREIWHRTRDLGFVRVKFLKGGLESWKAKGYAVEPYQESFHLDTRT
jgi:rhodanese-related sulfurtransferase